jgi:DNA anti-recombination protein RmuC
MEFGQLPVGFLIDVVIIAIIVALLVAEKIMRRRLQTRIVELQRNLDDLEEQQSKRITDLANKFASLKDILFERTNALTVKFNELAKRSNQVFEQNRSVLQEIDKRMNPLKETLDDTLAREISSRDTIRKRIQQNETELRRISKDINDFANEIKKMKNFIRERTIDLEL